MIHYLDPSAWVKRYFREAGSDHMQSLFAMESFTPACVTLGLVEVLSAIARKSSESRLDQKTTAGIIAAVRADWSLFRVVQADESCIDEASDAAINKQLRAMDALHFAAARSLTRTDEIVMISSDRELLIAAEHSGIRTFDPNNA